MSNENIKIKYGRIEDNACAAHNLKDIAKNIYMEYGSK